jgi:hypothetical protein
MADAKDKQDEIIVSEGRDGSATVDLPDNLLGDDLEGDKNGSNDDLDASGNGSDEDDDHPDDDAELRSAKRSRRRAKKDLIRKTNQEKDMQLQSLKRENEEFKRRLSQLERNTKAEQLTRIDKNLEDAQVRLEYAKMKLAEATSNNDGHAMVEAQTLWQNAQEEMRNLTAVRTRADAELKQPQQVDVPDPTVQRLAARWMKKNSWYNPQANDADSRIAKKMDELLSAQGLDPTSQEYWDELDSRLQRELPHRYNDSNDDESRDVRRPRNVVGSSGREASAAYGGSNRSQFVLSPERVKAMKDAGAWDNPERKAKMIQHFIAFDRANGIRN